jgi:hypothetical protein
LSGHSMIHIYIYTSYAPVGVEWQLLVHTYTCTLQHVNTIFDKCAQLRGQSSLVLNYTRSSVERKMGRTRWMDEAELLAKYGDPALVADLISRKKSAGDVRANPDFPDVVSKTLYRCWDTSVEEAEEASASSRSLTIKGDVCGPQLARPWAVGGLGCQVELNYCPGCRQAEPKSHPCLGMRVVGVITHNLVHVCFICT